MKCDHPTSGCDVSSSELPHTALCRLWEDVCRGGVCANGGDEWVEKSGLRGGCESVEGKRESVCVCVRVYMYVCVCVGGGGGGAQ